MPPFDVIAWIPIAATLTALGVVGAVLAFRRRGAASGLRVLGWALLPMAIVLTGLARLLYTVVAETVRWVGGLVISPTVWAGIALFLVSFVLLGTAGVLRRRRGTTASRGAQGAADRPSTSASTSQKPTSGKAEPKKAVGKGEQNDPLEGFEEIDEILKRRGIS